MVHKIGQQGTSPVQDKLEAITKNNIPKNEKVILGSYPIRIKIWGKSVSKYRHSEQTAGERKRLDMDIRTHQSVQ